MGFFICWENSILIVWHSTAGVKWDFFFENLYTKCVGHNKNEGDFYESFHGDQKYFLSNSALWSYSEFQILHHTDLCAGYIIDTVIKECQLAYPGLYCFYWVFITLIFSSKMPKFCNLWSPWYLFAAQEMRKLFKGCVN